MKIRNLFLLVACIYFPKLSGNFESRLDTLAHNLEESIQNNNPVYLNNCFDFDVFFNKICFIENASFSAFNSGFKDGIINNLTPGNIVLRELSPEKQYEFLSVKNYNNSYILLFRELTSRGINYHEYTVIYKENRFLITDIYFYDKFNYLSEILSEYYIDATNQVLNKKDRVNIKKDKILSKLENDVASGNYTKAYNRWISIPDGLKCNKSILLYAMKASSYLGPTEFFNILTYYNKGNEYDTRVFMLPVEGLIEIHDFTAALECIDKLSLSVNNDPFLNYYRGCIMRESGQPEKAKWFFTKVISDFPNDESGYFALLDLYIKDYNFGKATEMLISIENNFGLFRQDLSLLLGDYSEFICSNEFKTWIEN